MKVVNSALDWITVTGKDPHGDDIEFQDVVEWFDELEKHYEKKPWKVLGYAGWTCGPLSLGFRDDASYMFRVSGHDAQRALLRLEWLKNAHLTRVDYQVTVESEFGENYVRDWYKIALENRKNDKRMPKPKYWSSESGDTLYLGRRDSHRYFRLYDKGGEEGGAKGEKMRYEIEYKKHSAPVAWQSFVASTNRTGHILSVVEGDFAQAGILLRFGSVVRTGIVAEKPKSDYEKQLDWLRRCVRPVVDRLIAKGYEPRIREILFGEI